MNNFILSFFNELNENKVSYCHFKSNNNLEEALSGIDDLDLLIRQSDVTLFMGIVSKRGFRLARDRGDAPTPFVFHFFGMDPETGLIVHLHVYFRIITGGSILKNHWVRVENMFLDNASPLLPYGVLVPCAEADLILFVLRKLIEQPSLIEHYLFLKDITNIQKELHWLYCQVSKEKVDDLLRQWLPSISPKLFHECLDTLIKGGAVIKRIKLGFEIRKKFEITVYGSANASIRRSLMFFGAHARGRLKLRRNNRTLFPGGYLVSFVGSEASGKSTTAKEIVNWLSKRFDATYVHVGKPKKNWRTKPFWFLIKCYSRVKALTKVLSSVRAKDKASPQTGVNKPHPIVCVLDSFDRKYCLIQHYTHVLEGGVIVTDRYPAIATNGLDGPRIEPKSSFTLFLSRIERRNYAALPLPDLVFKMVAPLEVTLNRNQMRPVPEPENFVRERYESAKAIAFPQTTCVKIDTTQPLDTTILLVKNCIWSKKDFKTPDFVETSN